MYHAGVHRAHAKTIRRTHTHTHTQSKKCVHEHTHKISCKAINKVIKNVTTQKFYIHGLWGILFRIVLRPLASANLFYFLLGMKLCNAWILHYVIQKGFLMCLLHGYFPFLLLCILYEWKWWWVDIVQERSTILTSHLKKSSQVKFSLSTMDCLSCC